METASSPVPVVVKPRRTTLRGSPVLGTSLQILLTLTFLGFALLVLSGVYLSSVTFLDWLQAPQTHATTFTLWAFLAHGGIGLALLVPYVVFGLWHTKKGLKMPNRGAIVMGIVLFIVGLLIAVTGIALFQLEGLPQLPTGTITRQLVYWAHIVLPAAAVGLYIWHRRLGPPMKWTYAKIWGGGITLFVGGMVALHYQNPHRWFAEGPKEGETYFHPSEARTADGLFIPADKLLSDQYCMRCHQDIYNDHVHSAHKFSSFNNPAYLVSVRETRKMAMERDGNTKASRWCAGCHDPVPFFSGAFDDPNFDDVNHPTAHAGITCVACHSITNVNDVTGNAAYTIEASAHYPFAFSGTGALRDLSDQLIKAKPDLHKKTFLKPFHKTAEFCSTCHKVALPVELNHYKDFLRGQNHYDSYLISGASGHGARSFYYPPKGFTNCSQCHMPDRDVSDPNVNFAGRMNPETGKRQQKNHIFLGANTGLPTLLKNDPRYADRAAEFDRVIAEHEGFLKDKKLRIDLFAIKDGATLDHTRLLPIRPQLPELVPGQSYVVEVVVRTLLIGHHFTQGTVDSNEIWVDFRATMNGQEIGRNGALAGPGDTGKLDEWSHNLNVLMLDRDGNRINRRNAQDIFTPLYNNQIPPGAANVMHYRLDVPQDATGPIELTARLRYRKFDQEYMDIVHQGINRPSVSLPVVDICMDKVTLPVRGGASVPAQQSPIKPAWQRWNDYGIANLLEGGMGAKRSNFRQAEEAFKKLLTLGVPEALSHGHINLARVYIDEGRLAEAAQQIVLSGQVNPAAPWWTRAWLTAIVNSETATRAEDLDSAINELLKIVNPELQPRDRDFDFTKDYVILNLIANRYFKRRLFEPDGSPTQREFILKATDYAERVLQLDPEDVQAHDLLKQTYSMLSDETVEPPTLDTPPPFESLPDLARRAADSKLSGSDRQAAAVRLRQGLEGIGKASNRPAIPKLGTLRTVWKRLQPSYASTSDAALQRELAATLSVLHRELHIIFKPDEVARSRATRIYREKHPAANYAARDRVVYPTRPEHKSMILKGQELLTE